MRFKQFATITTLFAMLISPLAGLTARADSPFTEFPASVGGGACPVGQDFGPDGALWFVDPCTNSIGRMTTSGSLTTYAVPSSNSYVIDIVAGPDGAMWFTESNPSAGKIGRITMGGSITEYATPSNTSRPETIVAGPDGALWFEEAIGNKIGRITTAGAISEFNKPGDYLGGGGQAMTVGPDDALWYAAGNSIQRMTTAGEVTAYPIDLENTGAQSITSAADGNLWVTLSGGTNGIARLTPTGVMTVFPRSAADPALLTGISGGPDNGVWFANYQQGKIGRIAANGAMSEFQIPTPGAYPSDIMTGPDGALWFTEYQGRNIGRLDTSSLTPTSLGTISPWPSLSLGWAADPAATSYNVYRDGVQVATTTENIFTDPTAPEGTHEYYITRVTATGESSLSNTVSPMIDRTLPTLGAVSWTDNPFIEGRVNTTVSVQATDNLTPLVRAEYYLGDIDPGKFHGEGMNLENPSPDGLSATLTRTFGADLAPGVYPVHVRAVDAAGNWSNEVLSSLTILAQGHDITSPNSATVNIGEALNFNITTSPGSLPDVTVVGDLPAGIELVYNNDGTASLVGTPLGGTQGTYVVTIVADYGLETPTTQEFTLTVTNNATTLGFTSAARDVEAYGVPFSYTVSTSGSPVPAITKKGALPAGVTFTDNGDGTATIAGTATRAAAGDYPLTLKAKNSEAIVTQSFTLTINRVPVFKRVPAMKTLKVGVPFSLNIKSLGYDIPSLAADSLPAGLTFTDNGDGTGTLAGTPEVGSGGSYPVTFTAENQEGTATAMTNLVVKEAPSFTSSANATAYEGGQFYFQLTAYGNPAPRFSKVGRLPRGLSFDAATGTVSGIPELGTSGEYFITFSAKNGLGTVSQSFTLTVGSGGSIATPAAQ